MAWKNFCWSQGTGRGQELGPLLRLIPLLVGHFLCVCTPVLLTLIRMTKDEKGLAFFKGLLL